MKKENIRLCIFPHFYDKPCIPLYVSIYTKELLNYFDKIIIVTNWRPLSNRKVIESEQIEILEVENQGYDFGMFYKAYQSIDQQKYDVIACINDSNIVFGSLKHVFDWANMQKVDFWGLMDANIKPSFSMHQNNYHIQSHFLVFNKKAIANLNAYFNQLEISQIFSIKDPKTAKKRIIDDWEIGLSQYFIKNGLACSSYLSIRNLEEATLIKVKKTKDTINISLDLYPDVVKSGLLILKKKVVTSVKPRHILSIKNNWRRLIKNYGDTNLDLKSLIKELSGIGFRHILRSVIN